MGRPSLRAITACAVLAVAGHACAAEMTRLASAMEADNPFDLYLSIRWDRIQERARITREYPDFSSGPYGSVQELTELRYARITNALVPRVALGIYQDLELHVEMPYVLGDDTSWRYGFRGGLPANTDGSRYVGANAITPDGTPCVGACPIFAVGDGQTVYHGGAAGDLKAGLAWGIFNDRKDDTKPFWLVGLDVTFPLANLYDPGLNRTVDPSTGTVSPYTQAAKPGPFGEKVWKYDFYTALSRRLGAIDPYVKGHITAVMPSNQTYSNCDHVASGQMNADAATNCAAWGDKSKARLPFVAGLTFGTEFVPYEDEKEGQTVTIDLRLTADYTSTARFYNELTDATGKILWTEPYLTVGSRAALVLRASKYVGLELYASLATETSHLITGEYLGQSRGEVPASGSTNPNFDWRYDAPGTRFRLTEVSLFAAGVTGTLHF